MTATLASLWGAAPDITGGVSSVQYVRRIREGDAYPACYVCGAKTNGSAKCLLCDRPVCDAHAADGSFDECINCVKED